MLNIGDPAPNLSLQAVDGQPVSLSEALRRGRNLFLVFLRHLG